MSSKSGNQGSISMPQKIMIKLKERNKVEQARLIREEP